MRVLEVIIFVLSLNPTFIAMVPISALATIKAEKMLRKVNVRNDRTVFIFLLYSVPQQNANCTNKYYSLRVLILYQNHY